LGIGDPLSHGTLFAVFFRRQVMPARRAIT